MLLSILFLLDKKKKAALQHKAAFVVWKIARTLET